MLFCLARPPVRCACEEGVPRGERLCGDWLNQVCNACHRRRLPATPTACGLWRQAGMTSINDFATTYMCQSLPFGGVKDSGFDRFAGVEGLRGLCVAKAVCEDRRAAHQNPLSLQAFHSVFLVQITSQSNDLDTVLPLSARVPARHRSTRGRWPWLMRTDIPPLLRYPVGDSAFGFVAGLVAMFYGTSLGARARGVAAVLRALLPGR